MTAESLNTAELIQDYFRYQKEVYGNELLLDKPLPVIAAPGGNESGTLDDLEQEVLSCERCGLCKTVTNKVFGRGNGNANLVLIGEAPGKEEDKTGEPFVGKAGDLLNNILKAIGFSRDEVYMCNVLKCRPPENRDPEPAEILKCMPFLYKQIDALDPGIILALGRFAGQILAKSESPLSRLRGEIHKYNNIPVLVTYNPAALLHDPRKKYHVWEDVQKLRKMYDTIVGDKPEWQPPKK